MKNRYSSYSSNVLEAKVSADRAAIDRARQLGNYEQARQWERDVQKAEQVLAQRNGSAASSSSGVKNVGAGAAIGAVVAGPVGAVVGGIAGLAKTIDNKNK